jgi:hypothetical protein
MDIETIKTKVRSGQFMLSAHADLEAADENIPIAHIRDAILNDGVLEEYPDTGRGVSCLILGFVDRVPIHVVCGWRHGLVSVITVYIPKPPRFEDPWTRGEQ